MKLLRKLALVLTPVVLAGGVALAGTTSASATTTPVVYASGSGGWTHPSVKPAWIYVGQGGSPMAHTWQWTTWAKTPGPYAWTKGTLWTDNCIPNCALGKESYHPMTVTLSTVKAHNGVRYYSRMKWCTPTYRFRNGTHTEILNYSVTPPGTVPHWHGAPRRADLPATTRPCPKIAHK